MANSEPDKLGIIAGGGMLPFELVRHCKRLGLPVHVVALDGFAQLSPDLGVTCDTIGMARVGGIIKSLHLHGCSDVCLVGTIRRPSLNHVIPDERGAKLLPKLLGAVGQGDDALLRLITEELEGEGFVVKGVHQILSSLQPGSGALTKIKPSVDAFVDIKLGALVARSLGALDIGQASIVQHGVILGVEAIEGTDALIERCATLHRPGTGGVLVKMGKPQQDDRVDLPTIGITTIENAAKSRLSGIAVEAGRSIIMDRHSVVACANQYGLFVTVIDDQCIGDTNG